MANCSPFRDFNSMGWLLALPENVNDLLVVNPVALKCNYGSKKAFLLKPSGLKMVNFFH